MKKIVLFLAMLASGLWPLASGFAAPEKVIADTKTHAVTTDSGSTILDFKNLTLTIGGLTISDASGVKTVVLGSTSGTQIGAVGDKIHFLGGGAPIVRPSATTDLRVALINLGLYTTGGASPLNLNGGAFTSGPLTSTTIAGTVGTFSSTLAVTGNATFGGTFGLTGALTGSSAAFSGNETIGGTLGVTGAITGPSLTLSGNSTVGGTLAVTGGSTFNAITGTNETLSGTLGVTGNATFGGTLGITGPATGTSLALSGNGTIGGTLGVTGATSGAAFSFTGNGTVGGTFGVTGITTLAAVNATSGTFSSSISATNATLSGNLGVGGNVGFYGTSPIAKPTGNLFTALTSLNLVGSPTLTEANVTGLVGDLGTINTAITTNDAAAVHLTGNETAAGNKTLTGNTTLGGTLNVTGSTTLGTTTTGPLKPSKLGDRTIYASSVATLDSNVLTGGGTDATTTLNAALVTLNSLGGGELVLDGAALISGPLRIPSNVKLRGTGDSSGLFLAANSNCHMLTNSGFTSATNPANPSAGSRQQNISIIGITLNGNYANENPFVGAVGTNAWISPIWLSGVDNALIDHVTVLDARKFAFMLTFPGNPTISNCTAKWATQHPDNNDAIHIWGPATGQVTITNFRAINSNDDVLALNYGESADTGNGGTVFGTTPAAVSTLVDGLYVEGGSAIARVDGRYTTVGDVIIRNVVANLKNNNTYAISLEATGKWHRLLCENWTVTLDPTTPESYLGTTIPKGWTLINPQAGSTTELRNIRYIGDSSISATSSPNNAFLTVLPLSGGHAGEIILNGIYASKPTASLSGSFFYLANPGSTPLAIDAIQITNCAISGYAYLYGSDAPTGVATWLYLAANSLLDGAGFLTGNLPTSVTGTDGNAPQLGGITRFSPSNSFITGSKNLEVGYYSTGDTGIIQTVDRTSGAVYKPLFIDASALNIMPNAHGITTIDGPIDLPERASPGSPGAGKVRLYSNSSDHKLHAIDGAGVDHPLW